MPREIINRGGAISDPAADTAYVFTGKINNNFEELYNVVISATDLSLQPTHNRARIQMNGDNLTFTIANNVSLEIGAPITLLANGTGFSIDGSAVNLSTPQTLQDVSGSIYTIVKTGTTAGTDNYTVTQEGAPLIVGTQQRTGTTIFFDENSIYNESSYLTSGNLTLDDTGAVFGNVSVVYCDGYTPAISGLSYRKIGDFDNTKINVLSFIYYTTYAELRIGQIERVAAPALVPSAGDTEVTLTWLSVTDADNYIIERALDSLFTSGVTDVYNGPLLTYTDTGLTNGTTYYYRATAQGAGFVDSNLSTVVSSVPAAATDFTTNLVAAYQFNSNLLDYTANNYDGTGVNNINYTTGLIGNALRLANDNSYVIVSDVDDLTFGSGSWSWACLVRFNSLPSQGHGLAAKRGAASGDKEYYIFYNTGGTPQFQAVLYTDDSNFLNVIYPVTLSTATWYVLGVTSDGTAAGTKLYIDGSEVANGSSSETGTYTGMPNTTNDLYMGTDSNNPTSADIDGDLNREYFWKGRQLSGAEMSEMATSLLAGTSILP